jgi:hypothetical protein
MEGEGVVGGYVRSSILARTEDLVEQCSIDSICKYSMRTRSLARLPERAECNSENQERGAAARHSLDVLSTSST